MSTHEETGKKEIAKRLRRSNREKWDSLTEEQQKAVVNKYYELRGIEHVGIHNVLEDNFQLRRGFGFLFIGVFLGLMGGLSGQILLKYSPNSYVLDISVPVVFVGFIVYLFIWIDRMSAEHLREDNVLEHLLKLVEERETSQINPDSQ